MIIRPEQHSDIQTIADVTRAAFADHPYSDHFEQFIINALRDAGALSISLVAEIDDQIVGHIAFSPVSISDRSSNWYGLGPVSVLPQWQKQGIGKALIHHGLALLKENHAQGCVLLGEPDYYCRFGFQPSANLILAGVPPEYFLALSFDGKFHKGNVDYHAAFSAQS
ncbi:GNAT family N-acetyltransferase [Herminiimonas arsenitoxidans]|uniref:GNAT family N-acetyltransferase n=1 Tax=Herminiimonas arsenitoxidans TaxID=1809410 RepID=UPI0009705FB5|nr:N-acetyltransferase [Herminiimonas arsenitoxidans]